MKYTDHTDVVGLLRASQDAQRDMRAAVRETCDFVDKRDGQWESGIKQRFKGKPRYTDDRVNPIVNQIAAELENANFAIKVRPAGGNSTKELANVRDGIIRNIRNLSNSEAIFAQAGRKMVKGGLAAWLVEHDYYDEDSFDQDLMIKPIHDAQDRVWLDPNDMSDDGSDSEWGVVLQYVGKDEYEEMFPKGKMQSLGTQSWNQTYYYKPDFVTIGHFYYIKEEDAQLFLMSDGSVYRSNTATEAGLDELEAKGVVIEEIRDVKQKVCYFRMFDNGGWLSEPEETVFDCIPIVPVYGNFEVTEGKILYRGAVEKLMDMQRVHNYAVSRNVEEVALSPRKKLFMTPAQAKGHEEDIRTMNTNMNPVQFYNAQGNVPPPYEGGASQVNAAVQTLVEQSDQAISRGAGMFAANMGANTQLQSGVALDKQIDRGNNGTSWAFTAMETSICRTGRILNKAIPYVYDGTRQIRLLREDGTMEMQIMNNVVMDNSGQEHLLNDLSQGKYDIVCDVGPAYKNRQQEAADMFMSAMERDPSLIQVAGDIWMANINAPGFDKIAERLRSLALKNGVIPPEQMTQIEMQQAQEAAQQPKQPSADEMAMQIQMLQAETAKMSEENAGIEHQIKMQQLQASTQGATDKLQSKLAVDSAKIQQTQQRIDQEGQRVMLEAQRDQADRMFKMAELQSLEIANMARALSDIKNAIGADVIMSESAANAYTQVAEGIENSSES